LRQELAVGVSLANENDDVVALLSEDETEDIGDASNEILEGLAVRSRFRHLNTPPHGAGAPSLPFAMSLLMVSRGSGTTGSNRQTKELRRDVHRAR
jgi:hypothetical protein